MHILVAEDEPKIAQALQQGLESEGFEVAIAYDGLLAEKLFAQYSFDVIILDVNLPYANGFELCRRFRARNSQLAILMLTALGEVADKLEAFDAGADDYMVKPFHIKEVVARLHAIQKRQLRHAGPQFQLQVADLQIDTLQKEVKRAGKLIRLSAKEYQLLETLAKANGRVLSKPELAEKVWALDFDTGTNTVEVYINFLRNKIDKPYATKLIHTRTGFGYYLKEDA